jgi:hypothetical protein
MDGTRDHLCSGYYNKTPCTMLTTKGWKWLVWPQIQKCCKCCSYANGCGPLSPSWVSNASGRTRYEGLVSVTYDGRSPMLCHKWKIPGLTTHSNYYYMHTTNNSDWPGSNGMPCEVDGYNYLRTPSERADDQYIFDPNTISQSIPAAMFQLPPFCSNASLCGGTVCDSV